MGKIKIITDSLADIPKGLAEKLNITVLPLTVRFGSTEYKDGIDLTPQEFYDKLKEAEEIPTTSQVPPSAFKEAITNSLEEGYEYVIIINGSGGVSGTHQSAVIAKEDLGYDNVFVIDSRSLSYGCGMIVVEAAKMALDDKPLEDILEHVNQMIKGAQQIFSVDTLKYLHKNGRLSAAKMALGTLLNVKPILGIVDGKVEPLDKVRGNKKLIKRIIEICKEKGIKEGASIGLGHASNIKGLNVLKDEIIKELSPSEIVIAEVGCTIGSHAGPGTLAVFFIGEKE